MIYISSIQMYYILSDYKKIMVSSRWLSEKETCSGAYFVIFTFYTCKYLASC